MEESMVYSKEAGGHHFITNLAETQTSDSTILVIAGHLSRKMLERYSHIRSEAKRAAVEAMEPTSLHDSGSHL
jgi:hypothetical protein